jgi:catechol 2,3-dioxygenase-like lactoylglutathione lyase family enzyme
MFTGIKETCIYIRDIDETKKFYEGRLGLSVYGIVEGSHIFFRAGNSMLLCFIKGAAAQQNNLPPHDASGQIHFALEVETGNYEICKRELISKGVSIEHEHNWGNSIKSFYFRDPDGHLVEVVEPGLWEVK